MKKLDQIFIILFVLACLVFVSQDSHAQYGSTRHESKYHQAYDFEDITVGGSSTVSLDSTKLFAGTTTQGSAGTVTGRVLIDVDNIDIYYRYDSGTPTTSTGMEALDGESIQIIGYDNCSNFKAISQSGTGTLHCTFEKRGIITRQRD